MAKLIIWDEAPMVSKYCFEALDKCLKDILRFSSSFDPHLPFAGKVVVLGGDFRQILPIISKGSREDIVNASINSSYLWSFCQVLRLTRNMRLREGDSTYGESKVEIPKDILIRNTSTALKELVDFVYPKINHNVATMNYFKERAILAPTLDVVSKINGHLLDLIPGDEKKYLSSDSLCREEGNLEGELNAFSPEILNAIDCLGLPPHQLILKVGVPVMLMRNIDQSNGLCNGTRLQVRRMGQHVIECLIITGNRVGEVALSPRMTMIPSNETLLIKFQRRQFPIVVSFAMTINKSQGQTFSRVGLYLPKPVFTHSQLYVALSRVKSKQGFKVLLENHEDLDGNYTINVVYREIFSNLG